MVYIRAKTVYGGINDYKANTYGFARVLRSIFAVLERVAKDEHVTPDGALALLIRELPLQESFQPIDKPISIDMRYENERLQAFLAQTNLGKRLYLLRVLEVLLRLDTRNGLEALDAFELAAVHTHRRLQAIEGSDTSSEVDTVEDEGKEEVVVTQPTVKKTVKKTSKSTPSKASTKKAKKEDIRGHTTESSLSKIDEVLARGRAAIQRSQETLAKSTPTQRSQETLAKSGQTVATNPLLDDFLS